MFSGKVIVIFVVSALVFGCDSLNKNSEVDETVLNNFCQSFAKAISTSDTVEFYKLVDKDALTTSLNEWMQDGKRLTQDDLFFPFFFVYSPLKIMKQDLMYMRSKSNFFISFKIVQREIINKIITKVNLEWVQNVPEANLQKIELFLRKDKEWKVVKVRLETIL